MKSRLASLAFLLFAQSAVACTEPDKALPLTSSNTAAPEAFVIFDDPPVSTPFEMSVTFCGGNAAAIASIHFDAFMPAHQHGMNYRAKVADMGEQSFVVSNIVFHMPGRWELRIDAATTDQKFAYTGDVEVE